MLYMLYIINVLKKWGVRYHMLHMIQHTIHTTYTKYNFFSDVNRCNTNNKIQLYVMCSLDESPNQSVFETLCQHIHPVTAGKELWAVVSSALALARQNPTPFVSAVRIVEREEALDRALLEERGGSSRPLPPGRPRCWRACFFQVKISCFKHASLFFLSLCF